MKKIFIIFFLVTLTSNFSLAENNTKITVEDIETIFFSNYKKQKTKTKKNYELSSAIYAKKKNRWESRGIASCLYDYSIPFSLNNKCRAKVIRHVLIRKEKYKKKFPGDIFHVLQAFDRFVNDGEEKSKYIKRFFYYEGEKISRYYKKGRAMPGMVCIPHKVKRSAYGGTVITYRSIEKCIAFKNSTYKKFEKFKKDPSNEKVLGKSFIKYIKNVKTVNNIREKVGTKNYALLADFLNAVVDDVKKNNVSPDLKIRRSLLEKYSLFTRDIKKRLKDNNYKSIEKKANDLSKTYKKLASLASTDETLNIDQSIDIIFDINQLIYKATLLSKDNEKDKLLAISAINFMNLLIDSILIVVPENYYAKTKPLDENIFHEEELKELEIIIDKMIKKNKDLKNKEITQSTKVINKHIDTSDVLNKLKNLGIKNILDRNFTQNTASEIANNQIRENIDNDIIKEAKKLIQQIDNDNISNITKEISEISNEVTKVASEASSSSSIKTTVTSSYPELKVGGQSIKKLIRAGIIKR